VGRGEGNRECRKQQNCVIGLPSTELVTMNKIQGINNKHETSLLTEHKDIYSALALPVFPGPSSRKESQRGC
jgi:hypothetical protein